MRRVDSSFRGRPDNFVLIDASEIVGLIVDNEYKKSRWKPGWNDKWRGGSESELRHRAVHGDESLVASSDQFMSEIEDQIPVSRGWRAIDDVVGAIPNVPAYLAGHPQHMRRRQRVARDDAPLTIFLDMTSSAGISARDVQRRGTVMLALVRLLVEHRAVELWAGVAQNGPKEGSATAAWHVDTAPMDTARAAFHLGATLMARGFGYGVNMALNDAGGHWPFMSHETQVATAQERLQAVFGTEVLYVPAIYGTDPSVSDPVGWLRRVLAQYVGDTE